MDNERHFAIQPPHADDDSLRVWTVKRLQFGPDQSLWQKDLVARLETELQDLPLAEGDIFSAAFASDDRSRVDVENVLFYNVGLGSFNQVGPQLRFERSFEAPPPPPEQLSGPARYMHIYRGLAPTEGFQHWERLDSDVAHWENVPCTRVAGDRAGWHVWFAIHRAMASVERNARLADEAMEFGIELTIRTPDSVHGRPAEAVKGAIDGSIASFQRYPPDSPRAREVATQLLSELAATGADEEKLIRYLTDEHSGLYPSPPFNANGRAQLSPCDDRCVVGDLLVEVADDLERPMISGAIFPVTARADEPSPPRRLAPTEPQRSSGRIRPSEEAADSGVAFDLEAEPVRRLLSMAEFRAAMKIGKPLVRWDKYNEPRYMLHLHPKDCSSDLEQSFRTKQIENHGRNGGHFLVASEGVARERWPQLGICSKCR